MTADALEGVTHRQAVHVSDRLSILRGAGGAAASEASGPSPRAAALDAFRGLAILLMMVDHGVLVFSGPFVIRETITRLSMPMFFLLAGHLSRRIHWRHAGIAAVGVFLPVLVPWVDSPNVLLWWAVGCLLLAALRRWELPAWILPALALLAMANLHPWEPGGYDARALWGLMALGAMMPRSAFSWPARWPRLMALPTVLGRAPLRWYVGHLLALQLLVVAASS